MAEKSSASNAISWWLRPRAIEPPAVSVANSVHHALHKMKKRGTIERIAPIGRSASW
jgi:hypothetical protein